MHELHEQRLRAEWQLEYNQLDTKYMETLNENHKLKQRIFELEQEVKLAEAIRATKDWLSDEVMRLKADLEEANRLVRSLSQ